MYNVMCVGMFVYFLKFQGQAGRGAVAAMAYAVLQQKAGQEAERQHCHCQRRCSGLF